MRTNFLACFCALSGVALVGCPDPMTDTPDTNVSFVDAAAVDAARDARGDSGAVDAFAARDAGVDTGVMVDTGVADDAFLGGDANVDAFGPDAFVGEDAFVGIDAFSALDAFSLADAGRDAFVGTDAFTAMDAGRDAFVGTDAGRDAFSVTDAFSSPPDANSDAFRGPDAFHGDAFLPACAPATHLVINEIDYDMPGTDTTEFVEIYNPTSAAVPLAGYALVAVNGSPGGSPSLQREYTRVALTGTIAAGGYIIVTAMGSTVAGSTFSLPEPIQNGGPDAVVLMNGTTVVDAAVYEGTITSFAPPTGATPVTTLTESGSIGEDLVVDGERSLSRRPSGCDRDMPMMDWYVTLRTPGAAN